MSVHLSMCTSIELAMDNDRSMLCVHSQNQVQLLHDWGGSQNLTITLCHCSCPASAHGLLLLSLNPSCWCRVFPAECSTMPKWCLQACHTFVICGVHASVFIWVFWENVDPGMMVYILFEYVISPMWISVCLPRDTSVFIGTDDRRLGSAAAFFAKSSRSTFGWIFI